MGFGTAAAAAATDADAFGQWKASGADVAGQPGVRPRRARGRIDGTGDGRVSPPIRRRGRAVLATGRPAVDDAGTTEAHEAHAGGGRKKTVPVERAAVVVGRYPQNRFVRFRPPCRNDGQQSAAVVNNSSAR